MEVIYNATASSEEDDIVVCKKKQSSHRRLSDTDDDGSKGAHSRFQPSILEIGSKHREGADSSSEESDTITKKQKKNKCRTISNKFDSDDENISRSCRESSGSDNDDRNSNNSYISISKAQSHKIQRKSEPDSSSESDASSKSQKMKSIKRIVSRDSDSDDCQTVSKSPSVKKSSSSDSKSESETQAKHKRIHRKDKMLDKIRKTFDKTKSKIPQDRSNSMKPLLSICDNDSSSEEERSMVTESIDDIKHSYDKENIKNKLSYRSKNIKSEKPVRMSAKEAMENMTKIKSESCRMLREKRVSLPYHRPKQVSLKDILNRKRPELPQDKKPLSFKMNQDQLEKFAKQLEESQKHLSELYKSDDDGSDDENVESENAENEDNSKTINEIVSGSTDETTGETTANVTNNAVSGEISDNLFDSTQFEKTLSTDSNEEIQRSECGDRMQKTGCYIGSEMDSGVGSQNIDTFSKSAISDTETQPKIAHTSEVSPQLTEKSLEDVINKTDSQQLQIDSQLISLQYTETTEMGNAQETTTVVVGENIEKSITSDLISKSEGVEDNVLNELDKSVQFEKRKDYYRHDELVLRLNDSKISISEDKEKYLKEENNISNEKSSRKEQNSVIDKPDHTQELNDDFPEDEFEDIMDQIERDVAMEDSPMLIQERSMASSKPQLRGTPGSLIELDDGAPRKLSGVEILKQRYLFFSNMKTPEEVEREKEKRIKPGDQRKLLKRELVKQIREQSVAEWTKRLQEEQSLQREMQETCADVSEEEDELEKLDKQCEEEEKIGESGAAGAETKELGDNDENEARDKQEENATDVEEEEETEGENKKKSEDHKKSKAGGLIEDEAEVSEDENDIEADENEDEDEEDEETSSDDTSSDEEEIQSKKPKKGRIIKAFQDSDDETEAKVEESCVEKEQSKLGQNAEENSTMKATLSDDTPDLFESQTTDGDVDIPLAQQAVNSEDMNVSFVEEQAVGKAASGPAPGVVSDRIVDVVFDVPNTQVDLSEVVGLCSGVFPGPSQSIGPPASTQVIGEDILQLCSGRFDLDSTQTFQITSDQTTDLEVTQTQSKDSQIKTLFAELDGDDPVEKSKKFFETAVQKESNGDPMESNKGKLVIESSDEEGEEIQRKKRKLKKRKKVEKRALQISDDEEEEDLEEQSDCESEPEELTGHLNEDCERLVDYDSEENEVELVPVHTKKAKKLASEFMEKEAELTSEDEWAGSGDEDERGLDTMEREEGDDDVFHQGKLRRELEIMHMQDLMDQDRQEVRMLQEILLEDDLEGGSRQRRFRWNNDTEGDDERGTVPDEFGEEGRDEREAEIWRQQRHHRELFLKQLAEKEKSEDDVLGLGTPDFLSSCLLPKKNVAAAPDNDANTKPGEKRIKDVPSPVKNSFTIMQQQYLALKRGASTGPGLGVRGALQRLAASVEPPAERQASAVASKGSFVFATLTQPQRDEELDEPTPAQVKKKRKAEEIGTPKPIKKLRVKERSRTSLLQHLAD